MLCNRFGHSFRQTTAVVPVLPRVLELWVPVCAEISATHAGCRLLTIVDPMSYVPLFSDGASEANVKFVLKLSRDAHMP